MGNIMYNQVMGSGIVWGRDWFEDWGKDWVKGWEKAMDKSDYTAKTDLDIKHIKKSGCDTPQK